MPLLGNLDTRTESWSYVELVGEPNSDTGFLATETPCSIESDGGLLVTRAGPALLAGLALASWELRVSETGELIANRGTYLLGYRSPAWTGSEALPTQSDDPRVTDPDGDGIPGAAMTVDVWGIGALHLQVVSAWSTMLVGRLRGPAAEGLVRAMPREEILSGLPFPGRLSPMQVRAERSRFRLLPVPRAVGGCTAVDVVRRGAGPGALP